MRTTPITLTEVEGYELARAELYGLLARLWHSAPDDELLRRFQTAALEAPEHSTSLEAAWIDLVGSLRSTGPSSAKAEYSTLFYSVGKPEIFVYGSYHLSGALNDRPLATLRADLARLGLRSEQLAGETEDHISYVLEVMRYLIAGDDVSVCTLEQQRRFFRAHVQTWVGRLCETTVRHPRANLWQRVARLTAQFVTVETQAFDLLEPP